MYLDWPTYIFEYSEYMYLDWLNVCIWTDPLYVIRLDKCMSLDWPYIYICALANFGFADYIYLDWPNYVFGLASYIYLDRPDVYIWTCWLMYRSVCIWTSLDMYHNVFRCGQIYVWANIYYVFGQVHTCITYYYISLE